jgi:hypothetical protein
MKYLMFFIACLVLNAVRAQESVFDDNRFNMVVANGTVRNAAEIRHNQYLGKINSNVETVNTNASAVVLAQTIIYNGLSQVNSALKDGLAVKNMATTSADILSNLQQAIALARTDPALILAAANLETECKTRSLLLVNDVSSFVLKSGKNVLADYNARDELLNKVLNDLRIIDGLAYGAWRAMYWAKERGIIATLNPLQDYINKDISYANQIILNAKYLK